MNYYEALNTCDDFYIAHDKAIRLACELTNTFYNLIDPEGTFKAYEAEGAKE